MEDLFERLTEDLERERISGTTPQCASNATWELLAQGSLPPAEQESAVRHMQDCLGCLQAYASIRSLIDALDAEGIPPRTQTDWLSATRRAWRGWFANARWTVSRPIPAGWAVTAVAAAVLLTWGVTQTITGSAVISSGTSDPTRGSSSKIAPLSDPQDAERHHRIRGTVERVQDARSDGIEAYVVTLRESSGATYVIFAWGRPGVRPGEFVQVTGVFTDITTSGDRPTYKGVASQIGPATSRR